MTKDLTDVIDRLRREASQWFNGRAITDLEYIFTTVATYAEWNKRLKGEVDQLTRTINKLGLEKRVEIEGKKSENHK